MKSSLNKYESEQGQNRKKLYDCDSVAQPQRGQTQKGAQRGWRHGVCEVEVEAVGLWHKAAQATQDGEEHAARASASVEKSFRKMTTLT